VKVHRLKIHSTGENPAGYATAVELDGRAIYPVRIDLHMDSGGTNQATIYLPVAVELDMLLAAKVVTDVNLGDDDDR
jgi:hypothetical protein